MTVIIKHISHFWTPQIWVWKCLGQIGEKKKEGGGGGERENRIDMILILVFIPETSRCRYSHGRRLLSPLRYTSRACARHMEPATHHSITNTHLGYQQSALSKNSCICTFCFKTSKVTGAWTHPSAGLWVSCQSMHSMDNLTDPLADSVRKERRSGRDGLVCRQCTAYQVICSFPC